LPLRPHRAEDVILEGNPLQIDIRPLIEPIDPSVGLKILNERLTEGKQQQGADVAVAQQAEA